MKTNNLIDQYKEKNENINIAVSSLIVEELIRNNINLFIISPGSRSTPLTVAVNRNKKAEKKLILDERSAAFYALGYAKATRKPAVLICTSGSALGNYFPAIIEAKMSQTPLIILSADRPFSLYDTGANQTIDQKKIFGCYAPFFSHIPVHADEFSFESVVTLIDNAVFKSRYFEKAPAHINIAFDEPLAPKKQDYPMNIGKSFQKWLSSGIPYTQYLPPEYKISREDEQIIHIINRSSKVMIVLGNLNEFIHDQEDRLHLKKALSKLYDEDCLIFSDIQSSYRKHTPNQIKYFDLSTLIESIPDNKFPDTIIHIGSELVSKKYYQWISHPSIKTIIQIKNHGNRNDIHNLIQYRITADARKLFNLTARLKLKNSQTLMEYWDTINSLINEKLSKIFREEEIISEQGFLFRLSQEKILADISIANSMPVRYMDLFYTNISEKTNILTNRGSSGIDGFLSTSFGFANGRQKTNIVITGDVSFLHDLNSLLLSTKNYETMIFIIFNNDGSAIFDYLPIAKHKEDYNDFFQTPHGYNMKRFAESFTIRYYSSIGNKNIDIETEYNSIFQILHEMLRKKFNGIIEIKTDRNHNYNLQQSITHQLKKLEMKNEI